MAQVTDSLLAEFQSRVDRGEHINSTVHEEAQLLHGFREWKRLRANDGQRCEHGVWKGDHCYRCGEAKAAGEPTLFFCGPRVALTNGGDPSTWEWHEYDPTTMGWRPVKQPNIQRAFTAPKWEDLNEAQKTEAARLAAEFGIYQLPR